MSFESRVTAFSSRFLSDRSFELIVAPALADLEFESSELGGGNRLAVIRAVAGALRIEVAHQAGFVLLLTLVPACYYFVLIAVCFDFFAGVMTRDGVMLSIARIVAPLLLMSLAPVVVCFWPERRVARSTE
ncbi:MAG TPA: hypothetical protein VF491_13075 [Vicinamibacterales bacterium]|jgi:hypothetical protein